MTEIHPVDLSDLLVELDMLLEVHLGWIALHREQCPYWVEVRYPQLLPGLYQAALYGLQEQGFKSPVEMLEALSKDAYDPYRIYTSCLTVKGLRALIQRFQRVPDCQRSPGYARQPEVEVRWAKLARPELSISQVRAMQQGEQLKLLIELIGEDNTAKLGRMFGGQRLYVPSQMTPDHRLANLIGFDAALIISQQWGGDYLIPPKGRRKITQTRDSLILAMAGTYSQSELAQRFNLTLRRIQQILQKGRNLSP